MDNLPEPTELNSRRQKPFICTSCGWSWRSKSDLERHWDADAGCKQALSRPIGTFGAPSRKHCVGCHDEARPDCPDHDYRGCPVPGCPS